MNCTRCGKPATFVQQYGQWWCEDCKGYIPPPPQPPPQGSHLGLAIGLPLGILGGLVVIGILAAVAIPAFMKYQTKSKRSEARLNVELIYRNAQTYYLVNSSLPAPAGPTPPLGECCNAGGKCAPELRQWISDPTWGPDGLDFSVDRPDYYSYQWEVNGDEFTVRALGDLDCDDVYATFEQVGTVAGGDPRRAGPLREINPND